MPVLDKPEYRPPFPFTSGQLQTICPTIFRRIKATDYTRQRITTEDGDFLDIDFHYSLHGKSDRVAIISHGLEGNSRKKYMQGMAQVLTGEGWDVVCLNFRGCSGSPNLLPRLYHSGVTDDLHLVLNHTLGQGGYQHAALIGFSMGGNQTLKYLGETPDLVPRQVVAAVVFSVPCQLADSSAVLEQIQNRLYMKHFLKSLSEKIRLKAERFPELYSTEGLEQIKTFRPFDDRYTAPIHGFKDVDDYYSRCSSKQFLENIGIPTLMVQALDDPLLSTSCYPVEEASKSPYLCLEIPEFGGHVGFMGPWRDYHYWSERRAARFLASILNDC